MIVLKQEYAKEQRIKKFRKKVGACRQNMTTGSRCRQLDTEKNQKCSRLVDKDEKMAYKILISQNDVGDESIKITAQFKEPNSQGVSTKQMIARSK